MQYRGDKMRKKEKFDLTWVKPEDLEEDLSALNDTMSNIANMLSNFSGQYVQVTITSIPLKKYVSKK